MKLLFVIVFYIVLQIVLGLEGKSNSDKKFLVKKEAKSLNNNLSNEQMNEKNENGNNLKANNKLKSESLIKNNLNVKIENTPKKLSAEEQYEIDRANAMAELIF